MPKDHAKDEALLAARERLKHNGMLMKRAMDADDLKGVLRNANMVVMELRTAEFTPKAYYELYMDVFDQLDSLERYFSRLTRNGTLMSTIYELVQHTANALARMYLMITAGAVYIKSGQVPAKDVLLDLLELVKSVQHPQRGLFLRYYLIQMCKDKLPDIGTAYEGVGGSLDDAVNFIITNFGEMNRLWVRMQQSGYVKSRKRRERERQDLRILVGTNLNVLSALNGVDLRLFSETILPRVTSEIISCRDKVAQPYLFECIVQAFPVEYLYSTLDKLLETLPSLITDYAVVQPVYTALITRIKEDSMSCVTADSTETPRLPATTETFSKILQSVSNMAVDTAGAFRLVTVSNAKPKADGASADGGAFSDDRSPGLEKSPDATSYAGSSPAALEALLNIYTTLVSFALTCFPSNLALLDGALARCAANLYEILGIQTFERPIDDVASVAAKAVAKITLSRLTDGLNDETPSDPPAPTTLSPSLAVDRKLAMTLSDECSRQLVDLLSLLQSALGLQVLSLDNYAALMTPLTFRFRREVAAKLLDAVLVTGSKVQSVEVARRLCSTLSPLLRDEDGSPEAASADAASFAAEQYSVAKLVQLFGGSTDAAVATETAETTRELASAVDTDTHFQIYALAGEHLSHGGARRVGITFPPLVLGCLQLARRIRARETVSLHRKARSATATFHDDKHVQKGIRVSFTSKKCALAAEGPGLSYEFFSQAFIIYEEITDSKLQARSLEMFATALHTCKYIEAENYESLCTRCTQLSIKLLRKSDQVKMVLLCARLFWRNGLVDMPEYHRPKELLHCLQKALSIVDKCMPPQPSLFVDIFDSYVYFFEKRVPSILSAHLGDLVSLCKDQTEKMKAGPDRTEAINYLKNILTKIDHSKATPEGAALYAEVSTTD